MKSINKRAEEYGKVNLTNWGVVSTERVEGFEAGANYVLDAIEKLTNNQNWCAFPKQSHKELKELIEQLKK